MTRSNELYFSLKESLARLDVESERFEEVSARAEKARRISMSVAFSAARSWGRTMRCIRESSQLNVRFTREPRVPDEVFTIGKSLLKNADANAVKVYEMNTATEAIGPIPYPFHSKVRSSGLLSQIAYTQGLSKAGMKYTPHNVNLVEDPYCRFLPLFYYRPNRFAMGQPYWWLYQDRPGHGPTESGAWAVY